MPRSNFFAGVIRRATNQELVREMRRQFAGRQPERTGTMVDSSRIVVSGRAYRFENTTGVSVVAGRQIAVRNVGRPAAAVYAPTEGATAEE